MFRFGRPAPEGVTAWWGARAIFTGQIVDLLADRQSCSPDVPQALIDFVNKVGLVELRKAVKADRSRKFYGDSAEVWSLERDGFRMEASPQSSHGYLYIGAWRLP